MVGFFKGKMFRLVFRLLRVSPGYFILSMLLKLLFLATQVIALGIIFKWVGGSVNHYLVSIFGLDSNSYFYPILGSVIFILSSVFSFLSKFSALKSINKLEHLIVEKSIENSSLVTVGDMKNVAKLMVHFVDILVPFLLFVFVSMVWVYIAPISLFIFSTLFLLMLWLIKKGVRFSSKRYGKRSGKIELCDYLGSEDHIRYFKILLMSNYVTAIVFPLISLLMILSMFGASYYADRLGDNTGKIIILTAVALLQSKAFVGITLKLGSCYRSLVSIDSVFSLKNNSGSHL